MNKKNKKIISPAHRQDHFGDELERLLQASGNATGIPEPEFFNHLEDAGSYAIYLSRLTKQNSKNGN